MKVFRISGRDNLQTPISEASVSLASMKVFRISGRDVAGDS